VSAKNLIFVLIQECQSSKGSLEDDVQYENVVSSYIFIYPENKGPRELFGHGNFDLGL
jgi:hypothetical protein